ncbi:MULTISPECIES: hypothetical protein [Candidatus Ichthyocystis]|uniref:7-cyano-7-deazaguanine reductase n=1 Tax=Candidatus Ichthyocystis hellenicum TaxID=1561003 RepID=A0A0S4M411_9BURK|nr:MULTISPECIES: hypothetical protein [Ichthyocystis]CUT17586.1 7-cyano-7-deazaguanine reductase [Candidatus Ichthyocystis hellenicum]
MDFSKTRLGKFYPVPDEYSSDLLDVVGRGSEDRSFFTGYDIWWVHELTWLNSDGFPCRACAKLIIPSTSDFLVESKSAKYYFNSFRFTSFATLGLLRDTIVSDFSLALGCRIGCYIEGFSYNVGIPVNVGSCLDDHEIEIGGYGKEISRHCLKLERGDSRHVRCYTNLFLSHCPVTSQPDLATAVVDCDSAPFNSEGLIKYLLSYRRFSNFNEACCDWIFSDLIELYSPKHLVVAMFYMRRGGITIIPIRHGGTSVDMSVLKDILGYEVPSW